MRNEKALYMIEWLRDRIFDSDVHVSQRGVPHLLVLREGIVYSVCYFGSSHSFRVFYPWDTREKQEKFDIKLREDVIKFFMPKGCRVDGLKFEPLPSYGEVIEIGKFRSCVKDGSFIDYDGHGYLSDGKQMSNLFVLPSVFIKDKVSLFNDVVCQLSESEGIPDWATHVVWFNR